MEHSLRNAVRATALMEQSAVGRAEGKDAKN